MKISIITVTYNAEEFIEQCIQSVIGQSYKNIEYILIDGASSDSTLNIVQQYKNNINVLISEVDQGIYDAMNKGIKLASGDVIGILNADDFFADQDVVANIVKSFTENKTDIVYGNLWYVDRKNPDLIIRKWISKPFSYRAMSWGWMPAHPTFYARKKLFYELGFYDLKLNSCADYELMLRFLYLNKRKSIWLNKVLIKMRVGGVSNISINSRITASRNDFTAMRINRISWPLLKVIIKPLRKIHQYFG